MTAFDVQAVRDDFPLLSETAHGKPLVYLDNGATTQKPTAVLGVLDDYYRHLNSNVHRGAHDLADKATRAFEASREKLASFIGAARSDELIWTRGTTESINLVANSYGRSVLGAGDQVIVGTLEHHANIVPWQMLCQAVGAELKVIPCDDRGVLDQGAYTELLNERVKIVSIGHVSNALGTVNPVTEMTAQAKAVGAAVVIDGAQAVAHFDVDVQAIGCDFYAFSAHKMFGPTGMGALWGRFELLEGMPPWQGGGEMIERVSFDKTTFNVPPFRFEAGTPDISGVIGWGAAVDYMQSLDLDGMRAHESELLNYALAQAADCEGLQLVGEAPDRAGVMSFLIDDSHPADVGTLLDRQGIAVRTGHHCAQPLMQ
ncbi:MAG: SufS family cysteine desulfurase, partial [Granulosicoccaceae bacterium]